MMLRTESAIPHLVGQGVLKHKANLSCDIPAVHNQTVEMAKVKILTKYEKDFIARTKEARDLARFTQEEISKILNIKQDRYKHYEKRTMLPHEFITAFCAATRVSADWLFEGGNHRKEVDNPGVRNKKTTPPVKSIPSHR